MRSNSNVFNSTPNAAPAIEIVYLQKRSFNSCFSEDKRMALANRNQNKRNGSVAGMLKRNDPELPGELAGKRSKNWSKQTEKTDSTYELGKGVVSDLNCEAGLTDLKDHYRYQKMRNENRKLNFLGLNRLDSVRPSETKANLAKLAGNEGVVMGLKSKISFEQASSSKCEKQNSETNVELKVSETRSKVGNLEISADYGLEKKIKIGAPTVFEKSQENEQMGSEILKNLDFKWDFSRTYFLRHSLKLSKTSQTEIKITRLKLFLGQLFLFEPLDANEISNLNRTEKQMALHLMSAKYSLEPTRVRSILDDQFQRDGLKSLKTIQRYKRKEENVNLVFRLLLRSLKSHFRVNVFQPECKTEKDFKSIFYLRYFSETEFQMKFADALNLFREDKAFRRRAQKSLQKFYFPNAIGNQSGKKTMNKRFCRKISVSERLVFDLNRSILLAFIFFSTDGFEASGSEFMRSRLAGSEHMLDHFMISIVNNNQRELFKVFSEWDTLKGKFEVEQFKRKQERVAGSSFCERFEKLQIRLPWTVSELKNALLDSFFWLNEHGHYQHKKERFGIANFSF